MAAVGRVSIVSGVDYDESVPEPEQGDELAGEETETHDDAEDEAYAVVQAAESISVDWWETPYRGSAPPVGPAKLPRPLYFPGNPSGRIPSPAGADVEAYKRAISRAGRWPWQSFDRAYSRGFALGTGGNVGETGVAGFQRQQNIDDTGQLGNETYQALRYALVPEGRPHAGEHVLDGYAVQLLESYQPDESTSDNDVENVRRAIAGYCLDSIDNEPKIHYQQVRPIACFGVPPSKGFTTDCSGHATSAYYWARQETGLAVPDPNGRGFDGYGYTGTLINNPRVTNGQYKRGDLALYGPSTGSSSHVTTCVKDGDASGSAWCSHGSESAPYRVALYYRSDLLCVVRPALTP